MLAKKWAVLAKEEVTYGVDPSPIAADDLIYTSLPSVDREGREEERTHPMSNFGKNAVINIGETVKIGFSMELQTDWEISSDTPPSIGKVLEACNFTETIDTGVSILYTNNSNQSGTSLTFYIYKDSLLYKVSGCRGEVKGSHKAGNKVTFDFEFTGIYNPTLYAADTIYPTFTLSLEDVALYQNGEIAIGSYSSPIVDNFNWAMNNQIAKRPSANASRGIHSSFVSNAVPTVSVDPELVALSTFNANALWEANTLVEISTKFKHPSTVGKECTLTFADMQYKSVKDAEREGLLTYDINFEAGGDASVTLLFED